MGGGERREGRERTEVTFENESSLVESPFLHVMRRLRSHDSVLHVGRGLYFIVASANCMGLHTGCSSWRALLAFGSSTELNFACFCELKIDPDDSGKGWGVGKVGGGGRGGGGGDGGEELYEAISYRILQSFQSYEDNSCPPPHLPDRQTDRQADRLTRSLIHTHAHAYTLLLKRMLNEKWVAPPYPFFPRFSN